MTIEQIGNKIPFFGWFMDNSNRTIMSGINVLVSIIFYRKDTDVPSYVVQGATAAELVPGSGIYTYLVNAASVTHEGDWIAIFSTTANAYFKTAVDRAFVGRGVIVLGKSFSELTGVPPAQPTLEQAVILLYELVRNKTETTGNALTLYKNDGTTALTKAPLADDGTKLTRSPLTTP